MARRRMGEPCAASDRSCVVRSRRRRPGVVPRDADVVPPARFEPSGRRPRCADERPDAWIDHEKTKVGYEIPFNRHFYVFKPPRDLAEIDADLKVVTDRILTMIGGLSK